LSSRKVLHVIGPKGWDYTVVSDGRLGKLNEYNKEVKYGN
jgi:uncharacterized linocin/CFP29 family protein